MVEKIGEIRVEGNQRGRVRLNKKWMELIREDVGECMHVVEGPVKG